MENIYLEIGKRIRQQRKAHGLTREEFAENLSTTMQYISRLERAKNKVSIEYLYRIADALDCSIYTLLPATQLPQRKFFSEELMYQLDHCSLLYSKEDDPNAVILLQNVELTYLPEGFTETPSNRTSNTSFWNEYQSENGEWLTVRILPIQDNNPVVDAILNQKYAQACELGIRVDFAINDLAEFPLSNKETVVVLSNLLDNAIEACQTQKGTRLIRVKIQCSEEKTILSVMNTIDKAPVMENGLPVTTKADPLAHGYGLQNIVSILADHGACPAILCQDGWFQFSTVLFHQTISPAPEHDQITQKSL